MRTYLKKWTMKKKKNYLILKILILTKPINQTITTKLIYKSMEDYFLSYSLIPTYYINISIFFYYLYLFNI